MPSRRIPQTHVVRAQVLRKASFKGNATAPADRAVSAAIWAKLDLNTPTAPARLYLDSLASIDLAEHAYSAATELAQSDLAIALQLISHFFQVLDLAIARGVFPASVRDYYGRDVHSDKLPSLKTYDDAAEWGEKVALGEAARIAVGGAPLAYPSADEVFQAIYNLNLALGPQTIAKDALTDAQQAADLLLPGPDGIDQLILDLYDDTENTYRHLPDGARRDKCREWGLIYEGDPTPAEPPAPPAPPVP